MEGEVHVTDQDYERIYQELVGILEKNNLMWVADQVEEQIHIGKLDNIKIKTFKTLLTNESRNRVGIRHTRCPARKGERPSKQSGSDVSCPEASWSGRHRCAPD